MFRQERTRTTWTPWGYSQTSQEYADGVVFHSTASHGGFYLKAEMNKRIPAEFRNKGGWYEEDCEAAKVHYFLAELFPEKVRLLGESEFKSSKELAESSLKCWNWQQWEAWTGKEVDPAESYCKREYLFKIENRERFVVRSALSTCHDARIPKDMVGALCRRESDGAERLYLVDRDEYKGHFVADPNKHEELSIEKG